jgi:hypothetical protein
MNGAAERMEKLENLSEEKRGLGCRKNGGTGLKNEALKNMRA